MISVTDSGVGIPEEDQAYIFDDFYSKQRGQADERGYGLGLALSRRIIVAHGGSISVNSEPGNGSEFVIRLPAIDTYSQRQSQLQTEPITSS